MQPRSSAAAAAVLATLAAGSAAAEQLPAGRISFLIGAKNGTGRLANDIGLGLAFGFEAGYAPMSPAQRLGWGLSWATLWSRYDGGARVSGTLSMLEMDFGARLRVTLGVRGRAVLWLGGGGAIMRTNDPILPDNRRDHIGPFGAIGIEGALLMPVLGWRPICGLRARYGLIDDDQGTLGLLLAIGGGS